VVGPERHPVAFAVNDYDHVRDLASGAVPVEGVELTCVHHPVEEIFWRFTHHREWEASELSLAKYSSLRAAGDESLVAIPAFTSRSFRHSAIFVREDGPVDDPGALRRVGVPEWTQTATVYARGVLGTPLTEIEWVQAGTNEPGRVEGVRVALPKGVSLTPRPDATLNDLLLGGELDAVIAAHPPAGFGNGIVRLFSDHAAVERDWHRQTGIFPIMHLVALRADVHSERPWVAMNLLTALEEAKRRSLERARDANAPRFPVPFGPAHFERMTADFGDDPWPYGIEPNRVTLDWFLAHAYEQGVCATRLEPEDLFPAEVRYHFKI
jgi:4,5-dihydroxyphthalate decarboxylase